MEEPNSSHLGIKIISFLLPIVGAILYFVYKTSSPAKSKAACNFALWGVGVGILLSIISTVMNG
ncbi:hypothetical protein F6U93_10910 [Tamlana haliotis]|uniref:Uncharacterized protein n=1 Tax=Pseudotamlana haliotis TaxID=2614804 RepID=A0A6N6MAH5_9FLAO|nr:hypothetical protein [Tamlana haliotis]KAB1067544.1 hypothetical protein F6U93_10910 [Tamlana haliotis]